MYNLISAKGKFPSNLSLTQKRSASTAAPMSLPPPTLPSGVLKNVFEAIGKTPLVRLNHAEKLLQDLNLENNEIKCHICVKLEYLNPGGSIKDRIGRSMMAAAKNPDGKWLTGGDKYFLEASSGNTGTAIAMNVAKAVSENLCKGCYIVTNDKCSHEKINVMKLLGANVCIIKTYQSTHKVVDEAITKEPNRSVVLEQYVNQVNSQTHYYETAEEIYTALDQKWPDMVVMGAGTGGTFTGIATRIKEEAAECRVVAADPQNSTIFHYNPFPTPFLVEGIGYEVPLNLDMSLFDECQTVTDKEAFLTARNLAKYEGILCGGSSGLAVAAAIKAIVHNDAINKPGKIVVALMPDGIRNYMTKFVLDQWMEAHLFKSIPVLKPEWYNYPIDEFKLDPYGRQNQFIKTLLRCGDQEHGCGVVSLDQNFSAANALATLIKLNDNAVAIVTDKTKTFNGIPSTVGLASLGSFRYHVTNPREMPYEGLEKEYTALADTVSQFTEKDLFTVDLPLHEESTNEDPTPTVGLVARILDLNHYVLLGYERKDPKTQKKIFYGKYVATAKDVLIFQNNLITTLK